MSYARYFVDGLSPIGDSYWIRPSGPGQSGVTPSKLSGVARGRKGRIVWEDLSENAEKLLGRVVILGEEYPRGEVPWRVLVDATGLGAY